MSDRTHRIIDAAMKLSREDRAEIADRLLETLEDDGEPVDQTEIDAAWMVECDRRYQAYMRGEMKSVPIEKVLEMLKSRKSP